MGGSRGTIKDKTKKELRRRVKEWIKQVEEVNMYDIRLDCDPKR